MDRPLAPVTDGDGAPGSAPPRPAAAAADDSPAPLWWAASVLYHRRWWVLGVAFAMALASVAVSLTIPNRYRAETRVLLPDGNQSMVASALSSFAPGVSGLIGGGDGFTRYLAILTSPSTTASVVERFELVEAYDLGDKDHPERAAASELAERASFSVSLDYDYLGVSVLDESPDRAAQMANFYVARLNERHIEFQSRSASEFRQFLEGRLDRANAELDSAQAALQTLQERSGVVEPGAQAQALFSAIGTAQAEVAAAEVRYQALLSQYGADNPDVRAAEAALSAARGQAARLRSGSEAGLPGLRGLPRVQREYAEVMQALEIQRAIIETVQPLYEQAALQEQREADAVQVLDPALPPVEKAEPRRTVIVLLSTVAGGLFAALFVLGWAWWRANGARVAARLRAEAAGA